MRAGLIAGSVAAIVAALVSLPLRSPSDSFFNSATVVVGVLFVGLVVGVAWRALASRRGGPVYYAGVLGTGLLAVVILALAAETQVDRVISFSLPLAAIAFVLAGALVPALARTSIPRIWWSTPVAVAIAVGVGLGLAGQGDAPSGRLTLPPRAETSGGQAGSSASPIATATDTTDVTESREQIQELTYLFGEGDEAAFTVGERLTQPPLPNDALVYLADEVRIDVLPVTTQKAATQKAARVG